MCGLLYEVGFYRFKLKFFLIFFFPKLEIGIMSKAKAKKGAEPVKDGNWLRVRGKLRFVSPFCLGRGLACLCSLYMPPPPLLPTPTSPPPFFLKKVIATSHARYNTIAMTTIRLQEVLKKPEVTCFLDIDVDGARAAYKLACDFVEATDLTYGWSSKKLVRHGYYYPSRVCLPLASLCNRARPCMQLVRGV